MFILQYNDNVRARKKWFRVLFVETKGAVLLGVGTIYYLPTKEGWRQHSFLIAWNETEQF
jgi:hypothetical protein